MPRISKNEKLKKAHTACGRDFKIPLAVKKAAQKGLQMHSAGFLGGTETGWERARQLSRCTYISKEAAKIMRAWFARHHYTSYPGYQKWAKEGSPTKLNVPRNRTRFRGAVAWLIWGGDPAYKWINRLKLD